jgi:hypothetical protein
MLSNTNSRSTFVISVESKTTETGPLGATLSPMTVDMIGPGGAFGKLDLPEVKTSSKGALVNVTNQTVKILDLQAYNAYTKALQLDEKFTMSLDNGAGTIKALGMKSSIVYKKGVTFQGMDGPQSSILKTQILGDGQFKNTMKIVNPSPVEIDLGSATFEFKNAAGDVLGEQTANVFVVRGETIYQATGTVKAKGNVDRVSLVGVAASKAGTCLEEVLRNFNVPITLTPELITLFKA